MKKKLSIALSLVLCVVLCFALGVMSLAAEEAPANPLAGEYTLYSTNYIYGEEVDSIELTTAVELDPETVAAEDFEVYTVSCGRKSLKEIKSIEVEGSKIVLELGITGSGVNIDADTAYVFDLVGSVSDKDGKAYSGDTFECVGQVNPAIDQFIEGETENMKYRLFVPEDKDGESAPMLVWLHGGGEFGTENRAQLSASSPTNYANPEIQELFGGELFVLCPQSPAPKPHITTNIMETIYDVISKYDIDESRIYVAGCSQGGKTTIELVSEYPTFFAAAVSNCPYQTQVSPEAAKNLTDLPIIFLHATNDTTAMPYESIVSYDNLRAAGNENAWVLMYSRNPDNPVTGKAMMGHWSWTYVHENPTTKEEYFINGEGVYTAKDGTEYPFVSTPLSEIGEGYDTLWQWVADQQREEVAVSGDFVLNSTSYYWGEEVNTIDLELYASDIDAESISAEDFAVKSVSLDWRGREQIINYTVNAVEVNGNVVTLKLDLCGTGVNTGAVAAYKVDLVGEIKADGKTITTSSFVCRAQYNPLVDQFVEGQTDTVKYRLYSPDTEEAAPLYIWLHGAGEFGTDNRIQLTCSNLANWATPEVQGIFGENGLYVAAIQSPRGGHKAEPIMEAILKICEENNIDESRIYIAGCSMGGAGVHTVISAYPDFFAAAIPNCPASTISEEAAATLVDLPIMYVHALTDRSVNVTSSINSYNRLVAAGSDNVWCAFFEDTGTHDVTGNPNDTHWSWRYIHSNFTCDEENYIVGEGVYTRKEVDYPYTSVDLADLGFENIASWLAAQRKLVGDFNFYSTCYDYGEEAHTVVINAGVELDPATVSPEDFEVYFEALSCGSMRRTNRQVASVEIEGTTITLNLVMRGSGTNAPIGTNFYVNLVGDVKDVDGNIYLTSDLTCLGQINEELDQFMEFVTEDVQYRLYAPETEEEAPLYIWLHGAGEFGTDNRSQVSCSSLVNWIDPSVQDIFGENGLYVMAIQSPKSPHNAAYVMDAIMDVCTNYDIDMSRIYLAGCSMGGMGVHTMITTYPDFFAAAIPNCPASVINEEQAARLVDLPILYVHALDDTTVRISNSITSYNNIKAAGSDNVWCAFFENCGPNPVTGKLNQGHWSWVWIHKNFTSLEEEFVKGEGVYTRNEVEYPYVSTPLAEIEGGYANVAEWFAAQKNENVIYVDNFTATQGEEVQIPVYIDNASGISTFRVQLNSEELVINNIEAGDILVDTLAFEYNPENGKVTWGGNTNITGDGVLFTINATIVDPTADGEYVYSVEVIELYNGEYEAPEYTVADGFITVVNPHYTGDVNLDGSITNADLIELARYLVDLVTFNEEQLLLADYDADGKIGNLDLIKLARFLVA